jgi:hypothetical protein
MRVSDAEYQKIQAELEEAIKLYAVAEHAERLAAQKLRDCRVALASALRR